MDTVDIEVFWDEFGATLMRDGTEIAKWNPLTGLTKYVGSIEEREDTAFVAATTWAWARLSDLEGEIEG